MLGAVPLLALLLLLAPGASRAADATVLLLSFDGTRSDQIRTPELPTFERLIREGAAARRLEPVFPTNTFPNHVSLVTGVHPERHGIVNNVFVDPERGLFSYDDDPSWIEVPPLWSLLAAGGISSAAFHWVGSEGAWRDGRGPVHWKRFDSRTPADEKIQQILAWLDAPEAARPRFVCAWFRGADGAGHRDGPEASTVGRDLAALDASLGRLVAGLEARGQLASTTLIVVSDHGMARVERRIDLQAALAEAKLAARVLGGGGFATLRLADPARAGDAIRTVRRLGLEAYRPERAPAPLRLSNDRFGHVVVLAPPGTALERRTSPPRPGESGPRSGAHAGAHGYRPEEPSMGAILVVFGRGARGGTDLGTVRALDVAPTILALLGVPLPDWFEGRPISALLPAPVSEGEGPLS